MDDKVMMMMITGIRVGINISGRSVGLAVYRVWYNVNVNNDDVWCTLMMV